ncbi:DUF1631 family protein [Thiosocius teredinicola]|uniref:DUF1631 family protein n=1 Tax=Thiosocius teredinicola TaxID=1973002 RepID=UPI000990B410
MQTTIQKTLSEWEEDVSKSLIEGLRQLFDSSSQVLLEFADAAENNRLQRLFFDAQREFYLKEEIIVTEFQNQLLERMRSFSKITDTSKQLGADTLSLVDVEDYERSLALETIAKRAVDKQQSQLHGLAQRLSVLLGGRPIDAEHVPGNPMQVIRAFDPASRKLEVEKEVRLVFYTLFDRYVVGRLGGLYNEFNERLVEMGILPNVKYDYQKFGPSSSAAGSAADEQIDESRERTPEYDPAAYAADEDSDWGYTEPAQRLRPATPTSAETLAAISSLLMEKRRRQSPPPPLQTSVPITPSAANVGEAIADVRVLQEAPHPVPIPTGPIGTKVSVDAALLLKVKGALEKQRQIIKGLVGRDRLESKDEDVIDIVGMLFEAMLNEKLLPNSVKTLLSHLHTRYLKIAVQDPHFLDNNKHPARRLFERMVDAGMRWVREENLRAGIYPQLQEIVTRILERETLDEPFFNTQIAELEAAEKKLEQQTTAAEERTLESERGRARLEQAKDIVKNTIDDISGDIEVAPAVITFLSTTYADYLTLLLLRNDLDTESRAWSNAYSVGEALVAAAVYAAKGQPLGADIRKDLTTRLETTVGSLIPHHEQNIRRVIEALDKTPETTVVAAKKSTAAAQPAKPKVAATASVSQAAHDHDEVEPTMEDIRISEKLMREAGSWFVMQDQDGKDEQAVKLLWVNPHTKNVLFVDQHGAKIALMPAVAVARKIRSGSVRPMRQETSSFVARSLRRIRRALEETVNG